MSNVFQLLNADNRIGIIETAVDVGNQLKAGRTVHPSLLRAIGGLLYSTLPEAIRYIETLEAELRTKNDELHTLRFIGQTPEHLDVQPGALQIVPGPPTLIQRIKAAIAALKGK